MVSDARIESLIQHLSGPWCTEHVCAPPPGAAGDGVPDAAEAKGAAAPHPDGGPHLHPKLPPDLPVSQPAVLRRPPAGRPGREPVRPAGQRTAQVRGE